MYAFVPVILLVCIPIILPCYLLFPFLSRSREAWALVGRPRRAWAFDELRRYHTRPLRFYWGPENVHFWKAHFKDQNIDARIF